MAYRRKYKTGGRVNAAEALPMGGTEVLLPVEEEPEAHPPIDDDDAVMRAAKATLHAEALQRARAQQQMQQPTVEQIIASIPGISQHKRDFLKANPQFLFDGAQQQLLGKHWQAAIAAGVADDTPEINKTILEGVARDLEQQRQTAALQMRSVSPPTPAAAPQPPSPPPAPPPIRKNLPMTAPVYRDVPTISGQRAVDQRSITLTPEERLIARTSFTDPNMTNEERERLYASNKMRMLQMRANGTLNE